MTLVSKRGVFFPLIYFPYHDLSIQLLTHILFSLFQVLYCSLRINLIHMKDNKINYSWSLILRNSLYNKKDITLFTEFP